MADYPEYHNTTKLSGAMLQQALARAESLYMKIKAFYQDNRLNWYSPEEVMFYLKQLGVRADRNSYRAQITALTKDGFLVISQEAEALSEAGQPCHRWSWCPGSQGKLF